MLVVFSESKGIQAVQTCSGTLKMENAGLENASPACKGGKFRNGKCTINMQGCIFQSHNLCPCISDVPHFPSPHLLQLFPMVPDEGPSQTFQSRNLLAERGVTVQKGQFNETQ